MDFEQEFEVIPVTRIKMADTEAYSKHPFRVVHNKALEMLAEDIKEHGLLNPILVRVLGFGGRYEILSGHRRMEALELNGETEADVRIIKCTDTEAANIVIRSNLLQRDRILPSERARIYMLRNECLKREKYGSQSTGWTEITEEIKEILSKEFNVSKSSIFEYIRLNFLIEELLLISAIRTQRNFTVPIAIHYPPRKTALNLQAARTLLMRDILRAGIVVPEQGGFYYVVLDFVNFCTLYCNSGWNSYIYENI